MHRCTTCDGFGMKSLGPIDGVEWFGECPRCNGDGLRKGQSRRMSLTEVIFGTAIGFVVALITTHFVMPWFGHPVTIAENFGITAIFTVVSIVRGYCVRRLFEAFSRPAHTSAERGAS